MNNKRNTWLRTTCPLFLLTVALLVSGLSGCRLFNLSPKNALTTVNDSASLSGTAFGAGTSSDASLQKTVTLVDDAPNSSLQIGSSTIVFEPINSGYLYAAIPVKNVGKTALSFPELSNLYYEDSSGAKLNGTADSGYVTGTVGYLSSGNVFTDACLAPGETGYVILISSNIYSSTQKIEFSTSVGASTPTDPGSALIPQDYTISGASGGAGTVTVAFKNTGTNQLDVNNQKSGGFVFIGLDSSGNPTMWQYFTSSLNPSNGVLTAGQSGSAQGYYDFDGTTSTIVAFTPFETSASAAKFLGSETAATLNPKDYPTHSAWLEAVVKARNQIVREKEALSN